MHGVRDDIARRLPHLKTDVVEGFSMKCLASTCFMFFGCIAPAIAFGGVLEVATKGAMGVVEMCFATSVMGVIYSVFSGQPVTIIGSTGPMLAFTATLCMLCSELSLPFLPTYAWVGVWSAAMLLACAATSMSNLVKFLTKFTDEIFSALIAVIFVVEALSSLLKPFGAIDPGAPASMGAIASSLAAVAIATGTFLTGMTLRSLRSSILFTKGFRNLLADFAPTIGIAVGTALSAVFSGYGVSVSRLEVPLAFGTSSGRPWLVNLLETPVWARFAAAVPAMMATILIYMDQNITSRLINNNEESKLVKGEGYHLDMLVISFVTFLSSVLGLPWLVAATVRSLSHLKSLTNATGDGTEGPPQPAVVEQRLTNFTIHFLIGVAIVFFPGVLRLVPRPALMGLFMYLGVTSIKGNDFLERCPLLFVADGSAVKHDDSRGYKDGTCGHQLVYFPCLAPQEQVRRAQQSHRAPESDHRVTATENDSAAISMFARLSAAVRCEHLHDASGGMPVRALGAQIEPHRHPFPCPHCRAALAGPDVHRGQND